jgi:hypothetical protein
VPHRSGAKFSTKLAQRGGCWRHCDTFLGRKKDTIGGSVLPADESVIELQFNILGPIKAR